MQPSSNLQSSLDALPSKAARIRALRAEGHRQADIARMLGLSDQHVSNVLRRSEKAGIVPERLGQGQQPSHLSQTDRGLEPNGLADQVLRIDVTADGMMVLPRDVLQALEIPQGGVLAAEVTDGQLTLAAPMAALRRIQRLAQKYRTPDESVVDGFLAERRAMWGEP